MMEFETKDGKVILDDDGTIFMDEKAKKLAKDSCEELPSNIGDIIKEK